MSVRSKYVPRKSTAPSLISSFDAFWNAVLFRFGLGGRLFLMVSTLNPSEMQSRVCNSNKDHLYEADIGSGNAMFYLDNICHLAGTRVLAVMHDKVSTDGRPEIQTIVGCRTMDKHTLYNMFVNAVSVISALPTPGYAYLASVYDGREYTIPGMLPPAFLLDHYSPVQTLAKSATSVTAAATKPGAISWAPNWSETMPAMNTAAVEGAEGAEGDTSIPSALSWKLLLGGALAITVVLLGVYLIRTRMKKNSK